MNRSIAALYVHGNPIGFGYRRRPIRRRIKRDAASLGTFAVEVDHERTGN
jgi:hypothetical protein